MGSKVLEASVAWQNCSVKPRLRGFLSCWSSTSKCCCKIACVYLIKPAPWQAVCVRKGVTAGFPLSHILEEQLHLRFWVPGTHQWAQNSAPLLSEQHVPRCSAEASSRALLQATCSVHLQHHRMGPLEPL